MVAHAERIKCNFGARLLFIRNKSFSSCYVMPCILSVMLFCLCIIDFETLLDSLFISPDADRAGKIRFSGERNSVLLKASSGARCTPRNFVLIVTLLGTSVCLTLYLTVHQMKYSQLSN